MRPFLVLALFLFYSFYAFSQHLDSLPPGAVYIDGEIVSPQFYKKRSSQHRVTAVIVGVAGAASTTAGLAISLRNFEGIFDSDSAPKNETLGRLFWIAGTGLIITSVAYHISAAKNRKKALKLMFEKRL